MLKKLLLATATIVAFSAGAANAADKAIAGIVFQQDMFFRSIQLGMQDAAKAAGYTLLEANSESKPEKEANLIDTFVARGVKAIVISPISAKASVKALQSANDKGVKVILYNGVIDADFYVTSVGSSDRQIGNATGRVAAKFIDDKLGGNAKAALLGFKSQVPEQSNARTGGFLDEAKKAKSFQVVAEQDAWLAEKAVAVASDIMTAHPEVNVIYAANEGGTVGAVQAVRKAGKTGKVFVFGTDGSEQLASMLKSDDGILVEATAQQPFEIGKMAVNAAISSIDGKAVDKSIVVPELPLARGDTAGIDAFVAETKKLSK